MHNQHLNKINLIKGTFGLAYKKDSKGLQYYYKSPSVPQVMKVLLDRSFLFTLSQALHLNMATDGAQDIRM